jgi:UMF1 family MFS transporter
MLPPVTVSDETTDRPAPRPAIAGWVFFDWAAQPYFTLITTFVFAPYFATHVASDPATGQSLWGFATAGAGFLIALLSPMLGAIADASGPAQAVDRGIRPLADRRGSR